jgi:hypothetical protein
MNDDKLLEVVFWFLAFALASLAVACVFSFTHYALGW